MGFGYIGYIDYDVDGMYVDIIGWYCECVIFIIVMKGLFIVGFVCVFGLCMWLVEMYLFCFKSCVC